MSALPRPVCLYSHMEQTYSYKCCLYLNSCHYVRHACVKPELFARFLGILFIRHVKKRKLMNKHTTLHLTKKYLMHLKTHWVYAAFLNMWVVESSEWNASFPRFIFHSNEVMTKSVNPRQGENTLKGCIKVQPIMQLTKTSKVSTSFFTSSLVPVLMCTLMHTDWCSSSNLPWSPHEVP